MYRIHLNFINIFAAISVLFFCGVASAPVLLAQGKAEDDILIPIFNKGILLVEKEMIRVSEEQRKSKSLKKDKDYKALLFLEDYFLNGGVTPWSMKVLHQVVEMREAAPDLKQKAFLDCEAWRVLDHDLKNYEKKELIETLKTKRNFTKEDHIRFRKYASRKVSKCVVFISKEWIWTGPEYEDISFDVKARNAVDSVKSTYVIYKNSADRAPASDSYEDILED